MPLGTHSALTRAKKNPAAPGQGSQLDSRGCTGVANQRSCCLEEERIVWQATAQAGERSRPYALRHQAGLWPGVASCLVDDSMVGQVA